ncbi:MAG: type II toxin-antitoxin system PemK/MazF family toxin [Spirochaetaceae bacterium]|nr:type II toxin-antitoxin system PemK/MazF family toxin [Spirochaetaceae bacterium]
MASRRARGRASAGRSSWSRTTSSTAAGCRRSSCALTSNLRRAEAPGNVLLPKGAGNLPKDSVANVTQLFTIDKGELTDRIGRLGRDLVADIVHGIDLVLDPRRTLDGGTAAT